jgi:hypothetical protein
LCIDCCFEELKETKPEIEEEDKKIDEFIEYFENAWISDRYRFDRSLWNIFDQYLSRTNNISETYNHQINGQVIAPLSFSCLRSSNLLRKSLSSFMYDGRNLHFLSNRHLFFKLNLCFAKLC